MKKILPFLLVLFLISTAYAQDPKSGQEAQTYKAGGVPIVIPAPTKGMLEVGYDNREFMEYIMVAEGNRLLASFVLADDLERLTQKDEDLKLSKYGTVQVPRRGEYTDVSDDMFQTITNTAAEQMENITVSSLKEAEEEMNRRMKAVDIDDMKMSFGQPIQLGCLFSNKQAYGYGMIIPVSLGEESANVCLGATLVLAKNRLLFVYIYSEYQSADSIKWVRTVAKDWVEAIIAANQ